MRASRRQLALLLEQPDQQPILEPAHADTQAEPLHATHEPYPQTYACGHTELIRRCPETRAVLELLPNGIDHGTRCTPCVQADRFTWLEDHATAPIATAATAGQTSGKKRAPRKPASSGARQTRHQGLH